MHLYAGRFTDAVPAEVRRFGMILEVLDAAGELKLDDFAVGERGEQILTKRDAHLVSLAVGGDRLHRLEIDREARTRTVELHRQEIVVRARRDKPHLPPAAVRHTELQTARRRAQSARPPAAERAAVRRTVSVDARLARPRAPDVYRVRLRIACPAPDVAERDLPLSCPALDLCDTLLGYFRLLGRRHLDLASGDIVRGRERVKQYIVDPERKPAAGKLDRQFQRAPVCRLPPLALHRFA